MIDYADDMNPLAQKLMYQLFVLLLWEAAKHALPAVGSFVPDELTVWSPNAPYK